MEKGNMTGETGAGDPHEIRELGKRWVIEKKEACAGLSVYKSPCHRIMHPECPGALIWIAPRHLPSAWKYNVCGGWLRSNAIGDPPDPGSFMSAWMSRTWLWFWEPSHFGWQGSRLMQNTSQKQQKLHDRGQKMWPKSRAAKTSNCLNYNIKSLLYGAS